LTGIGATQTDPIPGLADGVGHVNITANTTASIILTAPSHQDYTRWILRGVAQKTEITVDENGIRADAGTIIHGVYGGILAAQSPFHMALHRPFLFLIRDNVTHALLFAGVVMNPTLQ
jgi:Serpin (serine protease inhibitor)